MALTFADVSPQHPALSLGNIRARLVEVTFDGTYPAGGESMTAADIGFSEIFLVLPSVDAADNGADVGLGWVAQYDYTAKKLLMFGVQQDADAAVTDPLDEVDAGDVEDVVVRCLVLGA